MTFAAGSLTLKVTVAEVAVVVAGGPLVTVTVGAGTAGGMTIQE